MGGKQSSFKFEVVLNNSGVPVFYPYQMSTVNFITDVRYSSNTVTLSWALSPNPVLYNTHQVSGFNTGTESTTRLEEYDKIRSNYYPKFISMDINSITIGLFKSNPSIIDVSWYNMLSSVGPRMGVSCSVVISTDSPDGVPSCLTYGVSTVTPVLSTNSTPFDYHTILSPGNIYNNGAYISQDGTTTYLDNPDVNIVSTISNTFTGLTNDMGYYMVTVNINRDGVITLDNEYMTDATGTVRLNASTLLIKITTIPVGGILLMGNINSNGNPVRNYPLILDSGHDGILCSNIMDWMNFTILACVSEP